MKKKCQNKNCDEITYCKGLCQACYARLRYWGNKTGDEIMARQAQLARIEDTMTAVSPAIPISRGKRKKA